MALYELEIKNNEIVKEEGHFFRAAPFTIKSESTNQVMKSFFLGCLIVMLITGCAKKKGENLLNIPITLEVYLTNHVKEVYYPSIEELSQNMVKLFYKTEPIERHPSFLKADFNGDNYPDYAFILPLKEKGKNKDSLFLIINSQTQLVKHAGYF